MACEIRVDRHLIRAAAGSVRYALVSVTAPQAPSRASRAPLHVALVLDRSGSMGGTKITLAREAVRQALQVLRPDDWFSLVVYDEAITTVVESTLASAEAKRNAMKKLAPVDARGSTDLHGGWLAGCDQLAGGLGTDHVGRCLILTDGLANVGITDRDELVRLAGAAIRDRRIATSTFGVGSDFDERLLHGMADAAGGHFYFIEHPAQIPDLLTSELGELLTVVARDACVTLQLPDGVEAAPLSAFDFVKTDAGVRIGLGDVVSGQELAVVVALKFPAGQVGDTIALRIGLTDRDGVLAVPAQAIGWSVASDAANDAQDRDVIVDRAVATLYAARARAEALELNRQGNFDAARARLERTARRIVASAGDDAELTALAEELLADVPQHEAFIDAMEMKKRHFATYSVMRSRTADGKARR
jgi:Ca-activated chloride channel family protein